LPATVSVDVLDPALADLQYEAERAQTMAERRQVILRGYVAIVRALVLSIELGGAVRATVGLSALCAMGALLVTTARAARVDGRVLNSAILAPVMLAPVMLRVLGTTSSSRLFVGSVIVAMLTPVLTGDFGLDGDGGLWIFLRHALVALVLFAPMAAAAAIVAGPDREALPKRAVTAVSLGGGIATAVLLLARWPQGEPLSIGLARAPFYVALFAVLFTLTLLPSLLVARVFIARRSVLAIAGIVCSPATLVAGAYIDHRTMKACLDALRHTPLSFAAWSLPIVIGAMAVGWRLQPCGPPQNPFHRW
jgi:hypothetical protein